MTPEVVEAFNFIHQILEEGVQTNGPGRDKIRANMLVIKNALEAKDNDAATPDPS